MEPTRSMHSINGYDPSSTTWEDVPTGRIGRFCVPTGRLTQEGAELAYETVATIEIVIVFAGNKHRNHDLWYDRAVRKTEAAVDQLLRKRPIGTKEQP